MMPGAVQKRNNFVVHLGDQVMLLRTLWIIDVRRAKCSSRPKKTPSLFKIIAVKEVPLRGGPNTQMILEFVIVTSVIFVTSVTSLMPET